MKHKLIAVIMAVIMMLSMFASPAMADTTQTVAATATTTNLNKATGLVMNKTSTVYNDNTGEITIEAYTTGTVHNTAVINPADIVLVLDVSGSMDDLYGASMVNDYAAVYPEDVDSSESVTKYDINNPNNETLFIRAGYFSQTYHVVHKSDVDSNGYVYYTYSDNNQAHYVYPAFENQSDEIVHSGKREYRNSRNVGTATFYTMQEVYDENATRLDALKNGVTNLIDEIAGDNEGVHPVNQHRVSIVTFADSSSTRLPLTAVTTDNATSIKQTVNSLNGNGATAIDYGLDTAYDILKEATAPTTTDPNVTVINRQEVVIVFSDGEPTYRLNYQDNVAANAVINAEKIKDLEATVYSISVYPGATAKSLYADDNAENSTLDKTNAFMHYISSNYPDATANADTDVITPDPKTPATGDITKGYYMTPDNTTSLAAIFDKIMGQIDHPTISLGKQATVVDTLSHYFTLPDNADADQITLQTSAATKTDDGYSWSDPTSATDVKATYTAATKQISVSGFDFDANYVSDTARTVDNNTNFYGAKLIITIPIEVDYNAINSAITNGTITAAEGKMLVSTNANASVNDSTGAPAATVDPPLLEVVPIRYFVNDTLTKTEYRFAGTPYTIDAKPADTDQYSFSDWHEKDSSSTESREITVPAGGIDLYSDRTAKQYMVSYVYTGQVPSSVEDAPEDDTNISFGSTYTVQGSYANNDTVTVGTGASAITYKFVGWTRSDTGAAVEKGSTFTMPANNVQLRGEFVQTTAGYTIEHYLMGTDGTYPTTASHTWNHTAKLTDAVTTVTALVEGNAPTYANFTYDSNTTGNQHSATLKADGSTILKLYYKRNTFSITYHINGDTPADVTLPEKESDILFGATKTVAADLNAAGYTFKGWYTADDIGNYSFVTDDGVENGLVKDDVSFTMPADNVDFYGSFILNNGIQYVVEHYYQKLNGSNQLYYPDTPEYSYSLTAPNGSKPGVTEITAEHIDKTGYTFDEENEKNIESGTLIADNKDTFETEQLVLKLYYKLNSHKVTYAYSSSNKWSAAPALNEAEKDTQTKSYYYGQTVTAAQLLTDSSNNYQFYGWYTTDIANTGANPDDPVNLSGDSTFTMPDHDVQILGWFEPHTNSYTVEHIKVEVGSDSEVIIKRISSESVIYTDVDVSLPAKAVWREYPGFERYDVEVFNGNNDVTSSLTDDDVDDSIITYDIDDNSDLVIKLYYKANSYTVTYQIEGLPAYLTTGDDRISAPDDENNPYYYGETVTLMDETDVPGFEFGGWTRFSTGEPIETDTITMPATDIILKGTYTPQDASYKVQHWIQVPEGTDSAAIVNGKSYIKYADPTTINAKAGQHVEATPISIPGYTWVIGNNGEPYEDHVIGDNKTTVPKEILILNLYYDANLNTIAYTYIGEVPEGVYPTDPSSYNEANVPYGTVKTVRNTPTVPEGYEFKGWNSLQVTPVNGEFTMPYVPVLFTGEFVPVTVTENDVYTITYIFNGEVYAEFEAEEGDIHEYLSAPTSNPFKTFSGWSDPFNVDDQAYFGRETADSFVMPDSDVEIYGRYTDSPLPNPQFIPDTPDHEQTGTLVISKTLTAPAGFTGPTAFTFNIYEFTPEGPKVIETVEVEADEEAEIELPIGLYKIEEENAEVDGYVLTVTCSDDDGKIGITRNGTTNVSFDNAYAENLLQLDDHFAYIIGYPDGTVRPEDNITRAEAATIFFRMLTDESRDAYWATENNFSDVNEDDWFNNAISTLANAGILGGYPDGTFRPNEYITRAELVKIAVSFYSSGVTDELPTLTDIEGHWAEAYIVGGVNLGFIDGYEDDTFKPDKKITRAETMKIVNRALDRHPHCDYLHDDMIVWVDNMDESKWYYAEVQEATNSHCYVWESDDLERWTEILPVRDWAALEKKWSDAYDG